MSSGVFRRRWRPRPRRVLPTGVVSTDVQPTTGRRLVPLRARQWWRRPPRLTFLPSVISIPAPGITQFRSLPPPPPLVRPWWLRLRSLQLTLGIPAPVGRAVPNRPRLPRVSPWFCRPKHAASVVAAAPGVSPAVARHLPAARRVPRHMVWPARLKVFPTVPPVVLLPASTFRALRTPWWILRLPSPRPSTRRGVVRVIPTAPVVPCTIRKEMVSIDMDGNSFIQPSASGAVAALIVEQLDIDDTLVNFKGTSAADGSRSISSDTTEDSAKAGAIRVEINGVLYWLRFYNDES